MPILNHQFPGAQHTTPAAQLQSQGPVVQVSVGVITPVAQQLALRGTPVPPPVQTWALIDTGASITCIDGSIPASLGLAPIDVVTISSASHPATAASVYPVSFEIAGLPMRFDVNRSVGAAIAAQGIGMLLGRDVLSQFSLVYNGPLGAFTLAV